MQRLFRAAFDAAPGACAPDYQKFVQLASGKTSDRVAAAGVRVFFTSFEFEDADWSLAPSAILFPSLGSGVFDTRPDSFIRYVFLALVAYRVEAARVQARMASALAVGPCRAGAGAAAPPAAAAAVAAGEAAASASSSTCSPQ